MQKNQAELLTDKKLTFRIAVIRSLNIDMNDVIKSKQIVSPIRHIIEIAIPEYPSSDEDKYLISHKTSWKQQ